MRTLILAVLTLLTYREAVSENACRNAWYQVFDASRRERLTESADIIWYPKAGFIGVSHVELGVDGIHWSAADGYKRKASVDAAEKAARAGNRGFFRFKIALTSSESQKIRSYLKKHEGKSSIQTCIGGACKAITKNSSAVIPVPFSQIPTLAAIYLTAMHNLGYSRISKVEYVGKNALKNLISTEVLFELNISKEVGLATGALIVTGYNESGKLVKNIIPVETKPDNSDTKQPPH